MSDDKLQDLPKQSNKYWQVGKESANNERYNLGPSQTCDKGTHEFIQKGSEATCLHCPIGYPLSPGARVIDKHIYIEDQFLI